MLRRASSPRRSRSERSAAPAETAKAGHARPGQRPRWPWQDAAPAPASQPAPASATAGEDRPLTGRPMPLAEPRQAMLDRDYRRRGGAAGACASPAAGRCATPRSALLARAYLAAGQQQQAARLAAGPAGSDRRRTASCACCWRAPSCRAGRPRRRWPPWSSGVRCWPSEPGYHALLAATYQQTGQWQQERRGLPPTGRSAPCSRQPGSWAWPSPWSSLSSRRRPPSHYQQALQAAGAWTTAPGALPSERARTLGGRAMSREHEVRLTQRKVRIGDLLVQTGLISEAAAATGPAGAETHRLQARSRGDRHGLRQPRSSCSPRCPSS